jgi:uncharacterized membrane protein
MMPKSVVRAGTSAVFDLPVPLPSAAPPSLSSVAATTAHPSPAVQASRLAALAACVALIALGLAWELWLAPTGRGSLALKVLPLLAALPGLWRMRLYTYRWLSLLLWLYVTEGAVRAFGDGALGARLALGEIGLALLLFAACGAHVRLRLASAKRGHTDGAAVSPTSSDSAA